MNDDAGQLADRVRSLLADDPSLEEKRMFGSRVFMVNGRILVGVRSTGNLLVRLADETGAVLSAREGANRAVMGSRPMGPRWLDVDAEVLDDDELVFWIDAAREDNLAEA